MPKTAEQVEKELHESGERMKRVQEEARAQRAARQANEPSAEARPGITTRGPSLRGGNTER